MSNFNFQPIPRHLDNQIAPILGCKIFTAQIFVTRQAASFISSMLFGAGLPHSISSMSMPLGAILLAQNSNQLVEKRFTFNNKIS